MRRSIAFLCVGLLVVALLTGAYVELGPALLIAIVCVAIAGSIARASIVRPLIVLISSPHLARASLPVHS